MYISISIHTHTHTHTHIGHANLLNLISRCPETREVMLLAQHVQKICLYFSKMSLVTSYLNRSLHFVLPTCTMT